MTQQRELATAIRCAVFDKIEDDRMLVSTGVEQAIEDALILYAAKKGGQPQVDGLTQAVMVGARDIETFMRLLRHMNAPTVIVTAARDLFTGAVR